MEPHHNAAEDEACPGANGPVAPQPAQQLLLGLDGWRSSKLVVHGDSALCNVGPVVHLLHLQATDTQHLLQTFVTSPNIPRLEKPLHTCTASQLCVHEYLEVDIANGIKIELQP